MDNLKELGTIVEDMEEIEKTFKKFTLKGTIKSLHPKIVLHFDYLIELNSDNYYYLKKMELEKYSKQEVKKLLKEEILEVSNNLEYQIRTSLEDEINGLSDDIEDIERKLEKIEREVLK